MFLFTMGTFLVYKHNLAALRSQVRADIDRQEHSKEQLSTITIPLVNGLPQQEGFEMEGDHEFRLDGAMYDIIDAQQDGHAITFTCISDKKEDELIRNYAQQIDGHQMNGKNGQQGPVLIKFSFPDQSLPEDPIAVIPTATLNRMYVISFASAIPVHHCNIPSPPPWC